VGELQLDVLMFRLNDEYALDVRLERLPYTVARWPRHDGEPIKDLKGGARIFYDDREEPVILLEKEWDLRWFERENPGVTFHISGRV
jgi:peptide chain release factor 3